MKKYVGFYVLFVLIFVFNFLGIFELNVEIYVIIIRVLWFEFPREKMRVRERENIWT